MRATVRFCLTLVALCGAILAQAEGSAQQWLQDMAQAARSQNYSGILMYGDPGHWDSMAITHAIIDGVEYEHLQQLTGLPRELLRNQDGTFCLHPDTPDAHHTPLKNPLRSLVPQANLDLHYDFLLGGSGRIAGRYARELRVQPRDQHRYGLRLWLDQETGLLLRSDLLNLQHRVLERVQFAQVAIGAPAQVAEFTLSGEAHPLPAAEPLPELTEVSQLPHWLPPGFELTAAREQPGSIQLLYADGLAAFSLFIDVTDGGMPAIQRQWGATSAVVHQVNRADGLLRVTAVGELPVATLQQVAASVQPRLPVVSTEQETP